MSKITLDAIQNFIIDNELTDSVAISLHPDSFDELVLDYLDTKGLLLQRPFEILGIEILQDSTNTVGQKEIKVLSAV